MKILRHLCVLLITTASAWCAAPVPVAKAAPAQPEEQVEAPAPIETAVLVLNWSDNGQPWIREVRSADISADSQGNIPTRSVAKSQLPGHDCPFEPVFEIYRDGSELRVRAQLKQTLDLDTSKTMCWDGTLKRLLSGPVHFGMSGRSIILETQRQAADSASQNSGAMP